MSPLEWATLVLVSIIIIVMVLVIVGIVMIYLQVREWSIKVNQILSNVEETTNNIKGPVKIVTSGLLGLFIKSSMDAVKKGFGAKFGKKN